MAEPLARGAAELDVLPERLRRADCQPRDPGGAGTARERRDVVRCRMVHRRLWQQRAAAARFHRLAADTADHPVVRRVWLHPVVLRAAVAGTLAHGVGDALAADWAGGGQ